MNKFLMCTPRYFGVKYDINPWMTNQIGQVNNELSVSQWCQLVSAITNSDNSIVRIIDGEEHVPDLVFTANAGFIHENIAILSKFSSSERSPEEPIYKKWFENNGYNVFQPKNNYEGEGDHLVDAFGNHWMGTGFRSSKESAEEISLHINKKINVLELVDGRWYHLDTCFCPLPDGKLMWYPAAFSENSQKLISDNFTRQIRISESDALKFSCNTICIGNNLIMPSGTIISTSLKDLYGYNVVEIELSEFLKAGGSAKCLVLKLDK